MKKILLIALGAAAFATSAMADERKATGFYLRGDIGAFVNNPQKIRMYEESMALKVGRPAASLDVGLGYNITDQFRGELVYTRVFNSEINGRRRFTDFDDTLDVSIKTKSIINALMINGIFDAYDFGAGKLFCGGGVGLAQVSEKMIGTYRETWVDHRGEQHHSSDLVKYKLKKKNNFSYNLMVGSSFKLLADNVNLDVQYKWTDYGTAKHKNDEPKIRRRGHGIKLGLRVDV